MSTLLATLALTILAIAPPRPPIPEPYVPPEIEAPVARAPGGCVAPHGPDARRGPRVPAPLASDVLLTIDEELRPSIPCSPCRPCPCCRNECRHRWPHECEKAKHPPLRRDDPRARPVTPLSGSRGGRRWGGGVVRPNADLVGARVLDQPPPDRDPRRPTPLAGSRGGRRWSGGVVRSQ